MSKKQSKSLNALHPCIPGAAIHNLSLPCPRSIEGAEDGFNGCDLDVCLDASSEECLPAEHLYLDVRDGLSTGTLAQRMLRVREHFKICDLGLIECTREGID